ncbi:MAG: DUF484 family protein [Gammaproteobacteria bacterium]
MEDLKAVNRSLHRQLRDLNAKVAANQALLVNFQTYELALLSASTLPQLFNVLAPGMLRDFALDAVSLILDDPHREIRKLLGSNGAQAADFAAVLFVENLNAYSPVYRDLRTPLLGPYRDTAHRRLFSPRPELGSIALLPLRRQEQLLGVINLGSQDRARFSNDQATDFLSHLGTVTAVCLENALNRERLLHSTYVDVLTGCYNRRYLERRLAEEIARAARSRKSLSCLFCDLDYFKKINDTYGHLEGDKVLIEIAQRLQSELRLNDIVARYGGEEFAVLLPSTAGAEAEHMAERLCKAIAKPMIISGQETTLTASIGIASTLPEAQAADLKTTARELLTRADQALYQAKAAGRNRVVSTFVIAANAISRSA